MTLGVMPLRPRAPMHELERAPTSAMSEATLVAAYGHGNGLLVEPCACGGEIACEEPRIAAAVQAHNATPAHRHWAIEAYG
jgi:hypothetical protein